MLRRASKKFLHFDKKLFDTRLSPVYKENMKGGERFPAGLTEGTDNGIRNLLCTM